MNRFDEKYNFRIATIEDVNKIMQFIHDEWAENHILSYDKELFIWQYGATEYGDNERINFVVMEDKDGHMVGGIGFIPYSQDKDNLHISTAITKIKSEDMLPMSGIELMKRQVALVGEKINFAHGTNPNTIMPIFEKVFKHKVGRMQQYYMINPDMPDYKIADIKKVVSYEPEESGYILSAFESIDDIDFDFNKKFEKMAVKSYEFLKKRYFEHPVYTYVKWAVLSEEGSTAGIIFGREINVSDRKVLRIVDYRGELNDLYKCGSALRKLLRESGYEYIDIMVDELPEDSMKKCGFALLDPDGDNIIPNYFEPFVKKNIKDHFQKNGDVVIFKADGDQDRPSRRS